MLLSLLMHSLPGQDLDALEVEVNDLIKRVTPFMDMPDVMCTNH